MVTLRSSLWAMPRDPSPFAAISERLASVAGLAAVSPHITLRDAVATPFEVTLVGVAHEAVKYRCITLTTAPDPRLPDGAHLSLLYGSLTEPRRRQLCTLVDLPLPMTLTIDRVERWNTSANDHRLWRVAATDG